jgi:hypothetical protein
MKIALGIVVVFCIFLICSYLYRKEQEDSEVKPWPPHISKCPEYWEVMPGESTQCQNTTGINTPGGTTTAVTNNPVTAFDGNNLSTVKAQTQYIHWDGISNIN